MLRWLGCVVAYVLLTLPFQAQAVAQISVEPLVEAIQQPGFSGSVKGSLSLLRGNSHVLETRGEAALRFATPHPDNPDHENFLFRDRLVWYGSAGLRDVNEERVVNNGFMHLRYTRMQWLRFGAEVYAQAQYDEIRLLSRRMLGGAGLRAILFDAKHLSIWAGSGYMHERERRNIPDADRPPRGPDAIHVTNHRLNNYLTWVLDLYEERLEVVNVVYVQPRLDDFRDFQLLEQLSLSFKLTDRFAFTSDLLVRHDTRAPRSLKRTDLQLTQGLSLSF